MKMTLASGNLLTAVFAALLGVVLMSHAPNATAAEGEHAAALKNEDGSWKYTNKLADSSSPYLLQHAHNPVDWYPWGPEAFEAAKESGKPIFLSVGYSTCYWCHVMERQSFENPQIAALMNEHFINVKVDREERPDVDDIYMSAVQMLNQGRGGWPMSVFLTPPGASGPDDPGLRPFFAGTYFPPSPARGMPSFPQVLTGLSKAWTESRKDVIARSEMVADAIKQSLGKRQQGGRLTADHYRTAVDVLIGSYDHAHGGFGDAPKFPTPCNIDLLIAVHNRKPNDAIWKPIEHTLDRMARGGMYDQVGGGFHRYSTDSQWLVPHFEKMLYDNGQLLETYCDAHAIKPMAGDPEFYTRVIRKTCEYVLREMLDDTGAFWSAQDAEVDAREGKNYIWVERQINEALGPPMNAKLAKLAIEMYGLAGGTNFRDPHHPDEPATNVLYLPSPLNELAKKHDMSMAELLKKKATIDKQLLTVRDKRKQPGTDDKVLVSWNGLMIAGMAKAGKTLDEKRYIDAASRAADYILKEMRDDDGGLYRTMRKGAVNTRIKGFLDDYACFIHGLIELHRATGDDKWLTAARELTEVVDKRFASPDGGYFDTLADQPDLFVRTRMIYDGAIPGANSIMVHNLIDLFELTEKKAYFDAAVKSLQSFAKALEQFGAGMTHMNHALLRAAAIDPSILEGAEDGKRVVQKGPVKIELADNRLVFEDGKAKIELKITIAEGYHINSNKPGVEGLIPLSLSIQNAEGLALAPSYPTGRNETYPFADKAVAVHEGEIALTATLTEIADTPDEAAPRLVVQYQACDDKTCLLPETIGFDLKIVR